MSADDTGERLARVETKLEHVEKSLDDMSGKVSDLHELVLQGKGAAWALRFIWIGLGGLAAWLVAKVTSLFPTVGR